MARQQTGIPRHRGNRVQVTLGEGEDVAAAHENTQRLLTGMMALQDRVGLVDEGLSRRVNEMLLSDLAVNLPTPNVQDRLFVAFDTGEWFYDIGTTWTRPRLRQSTAAGLPSPSAGLNGSLMIDTTNNALVYYTGNQRFRLTGIAF